MTKQVNKVMVAPKAALLRVRLMLASALKVRGTERLIIERLEAEQEPFVCEDIEVLNEKRVISRQNKRCIYINTR